MIDENAFGLLVSYHAIEDDEYGLEPDEFVARVGQFREIVLGLVREAAPGADTLALDLGHAIYFELADGDQQGDPVAWLKDMRERLGACEIESACVLSHGGRWLDARSEVPVVEAVGGDVSLLRVSLPSEPLRRALAAEVASHDDEETPGWGPGVFVDAEAIEALGLSFKNSPTPLGVAGAVFYRVGR
jgi:hypothetical protein